MGYGGISKNEPDSTAAALIPLANGDESFGETCSLQSTSL